MAPPSRHDDGNSRVSRSAFAPTSRLRGEVKPPSLRTEPASGWQRFWFWMTAPSPMEAAPPTTELPAVRADFQSCLDGATDAEARDLGKRIALARTLRELWHIRASLYGYLARTRSQGEAEARLQALNHHFSGRFSRSSFAPLDP